MKKLRIYYHILGTDPYYKKVSSLEEAKNIIDAIADLLDTKVYEHVFPDHCSVAGLEEFDEESQEWTTWFDDDGLDFEEHFNELEDDYGENTD